MTSFCLSQPNCKIGFKAGTCWKTMCHTWREREHIPCSERGPTWSCQYTMEEKGSCNSPFPVLTFKATSPFQRRLAPVLTARLTNLAAHSLLMKPVAYLQPACEFSASSLTVSLCSLSAFSCPGAQRGQWSWVLFPAPCYPSESCFNLSVPELAHLKNREHRACSSHRGT